MVGDGACCNLGVVVGDGLNDCTLVDFNTFSTLRAGVTGRVIGIYNGIAFGTLGNMGGNGKIGKRS